MNQDPKAALERLISALEAHFQAAQSDNDLDLEEAENELQDAFFTYDNVLFDVLGVELPFDMIDEEDIEDDDDDDDFEYFDDDDDEDDAELVDEEDYL